MKCRENRRARKKRDKRFLLRLAEKLFASRLSRLQGGKNLEYYKFRCVPKTEIRCGRRVFSRQMRMWLVPNAKYGDTLRHLVAMCGEMTVDLPASIFRRGEHS